MSDAAVIDSPSFVPITTPIAPVSPVVSSPSSDWRTYLNDELKADPIVSSWAEKASEKDIPALIKSYANASKRMGSAINLPGKDAKPEDVQALRAKLYEAGVFQAPPADPKEYGLVKPADLPEGLQWSDELSGKFATALHKHGVPKAALADLLPLYMEAIGGTTAALKVDRETALAALKSKYGEKYDERVEMVKRMMGGILQTPDELAFMEQTGLADHPKFLSVLLRLAPLAMQDSSFIDSLPRQGGEISGEKAKEEYAKIISDPTHPMYEGYRRRDPKVESYITELYRSAYGNGKVTG